MAIRVVREEDGFDLPRLGQEDGSSFGFHDRWHLGMDPTGKFVVDLADWEARDLYEMLDKDYKAKQIENVLALPIISAEWTITPAKGDKGEAEWLKEYWEADHFSGGCRTSLDQIIALMTSAFWYKRAYFEKVFRKGTRQFEGKIVYDDVAWRPQTTCRLMRDPRNGRYRGFEQEAMYLGPEISRTTKWPIQIKPERAFVYTHGTRRDPLNGASDMEVAFWAWKTKQKVLMLWFQFLQSVSLPKTIVKASDQTTATQIAKEISRMKSSGVLPVSAAGGPNAVGIETLDVSGKGSEQFQAAINWLDQAATQSVLAGFLDLQTSAANGAGSYALSNDASSFFLQALEAKVSEMEDQIRQQLFAPLIVHNFGAEATIPRLTFEPLNDTDKEVAVDLLKAMLAMPAGAASPVPHEFIATLAEMVADYLGLDGDKVREDFKKTLDAAAQAAAEEAAAAEPGNPMAPAVAGVAGATKAAAEAVKAGLSPKEAFKASRDEDEAERKATAAKEKTSDEARKRRQKAREALVKAKSGRG